MTNGNGNGLIAWLTKTSWRGVYNHGDSYPDYLGRELCNHIINLLEGYTTRKGIFLKFPTIRSAMEYLVDRLSREFADWDAYLNENWCEYCLKRNGTPHSINVLRMDKPESILTPRDPECKHHSHFKGPKYQVPSSRACPLNHRYVWIIDYENISIDIIASQQKSDKADDNLLLSNNFIPYRWVKYYNSPENGYKKRALNSEYRFVKIYTIDFMKYNLTNNILKLREFADKELDNIIKLNELLN